MKTAGCRRLPAGVREAIMPASSLDPLIMEDRHGQQAQSKTAQSEALLASRPRQGGDDEGLHALIGEKRRDLTTVTPNGLRTFRTVRDARGVAKVGDTLVRQLLHDGVGDS